jgi:hypothetical protein
VARIAVKPQTLRADPRDMGDRCIQCLNEVDEDRGYENSIGDVLCGACYLALRRPRAKGVKRSPFERHQPESRRRPRG